MSNAELSFSTRLRAAEAPERFQAERDIDIAVGVIAARHGVSPDDAHQRLRHAAARAGITEAKAARAFKALLENPH